MDEEREVHRLYRRYESGVEMKNRYLLDTNILAFLITGEIHEVSKDVRQIIEDYNNCLYTSVICITELIQLNRIGKIRLKKGQDIKSSFLLIKEQLGVNIEPFNESHTSTLSILDVMDGHSDPFDHAIISQAITDRYTLISSDSKFRHYKNQSLSFVYNKR